MITRIAQTLSGAAVLLLFAGLLEAAPAQGLRPSPPAAPAQRTGPSPLSGEMTMLDGVMCEMVTAIARADGTAAMKDIESLRGPAEKTQQALRAGALSLPKNGDRLDDFQRNYDALHAQLEALGRAGTRNNVEAMLMITRQLLEGCVSCHRTFRK